MFLEAQNRAVLDAHNRGLAAKNWALEGLCRSEVADSYHFDEAQGQNRDLYQKLDPNLH